MTKNEALAIAKAHIARQNQEQPFDPDYEYSIAAPEEYFDCWYFSYRIINRRGLAESEWELFAGAPGFTVSKADKSATTIGWQMFQQLKQREKLFQKASVIAHESFRSELTLQVLRKHFKMPLAELLLLKRSLNAPDLAEDQKKLLLVSQFLLEAGLSLNS